MKLRMVSRGSPESTKIYDVETGEELERVQSVYFGITAGGTAELIIRIFPEPNHIDIDVEGEVNKDGETPHV